MTVHYHAENPADSYLEAGTGTVMSNVLLLIVLATLGFILLVFTLIYAITGSTF